MLSLSKAGSGFGELALLNADSKRVATVIATENSTFITIAKKDYLYFLK